MEPEYAEGFRIVLVGIIGVFANLTIVMFVVKILGRVYGKPKKQPKPQES